MPWMCWFWKAPSFWTAMVAMIVYWDARALHGDFVYDDAGSVIRNVVVNGNVPWREAFTRDYWGVEMKTAQSHKSFRPITTLSLKANYIWAQHYQNENDKHPPTFTFHCVNVLLHGIVTGMITRATGYILSSKDIIVTQLLVGFLFGLHPVHAEVVSNITSRGELLMSIFFLWAFLSFASTRQHSQRSHKILHPLSSQQQQTWWQRVWGICIWPWICMTLSLFSKEQGATTLISLVVWDFLQYHGNVQTLFQKLLGKHNNNHHDTTTNDRMEAWQFIIRTLILAIQTLLMVAWRYMLNGETSPDFIEAQNPAGFAQHRFTRAFSVTWVYCLYIWDALWPYQLCPDWSGLSIDLITSLQDDSRAIVVIVLWYFSAYSLWTMIVPISFPTTCTNQEEEPTKMKSVISHSTDTETITTVKNKPKCTKTRQEDTMTLPNDWWWNEDTLRKVNMAIWAFTFTPFLLSSNILVVVGLMKADRVIYLPLFGFCLLEALFLQKLRSGASTMSTSIGNQRELKFWISHFGVLFQLFIFCGRTHERNIAWSDSLRLWESAYAINPKSHHTMYNYGYELSIRQRYHEAEVVLRPIGDPRVEGPSNTFVYAMVLFNLQRCHRANELLEDAFRVIAEQRNEGGSPRNTDSHLSRVESNLLVAKAHCTEDIQERGRLLYQSVETDRTNEYAIQLATEFMKKLEQMNILS